MAAPDRIKITHQKPMTSPTILAALDTFQQAANRGTAVYLSPELVQELRNALEIEPNADGVPLGPFSEGDLRQQWNAQADERNQWESLGSGEQLAWAQARAIGADRSVRAALKTEPEGEGPALDHANLIGFAFGREPWATWLRKGGCLESAHCELSDLMLAVLARWGIPAALPSPEPPAEALAARPLLEQVAAMADCIGAQTVGQITAISNRAAAWLRENPPGQPVAIEPKGCPTPGACSCVEPASAAPGSGDVGEAAGIAEWLNKRGQMADLGVKDWYFRAATLLQRQATDLAALREVAAGERLQIVKAGIRAGYNLGHHHTVEGGWGDPDEVADDIAQDTLDDLSPLPAPQAGEGDA